MIKFNKYSEIRNYISNELMQEDLVYSLPTVLNIEVDRRVLQFTKVIRTTKSSKPKFVYGNSFVEVSDCDLRSLCKEFNRLDTFIKEINDFNKRNDLVKDLQKDLGRDLEKELLDLGIQPNNVFVLNKTVSLNTVKNLDSDGLQFYNLAYLEDLKKAISSVNHVIDTAHWFKSVKNYNKLTAEEKSRYHAFKFLKSNFKINSIDSILRDVWKITHRCGLEIPYFNQCMSLSNTAKNLTNWLISHNIDCIYFSDTSTACMHNLYVLLNEGWRIAETTQLQNAYDFEDIEDAFMLVHDKIRTN